MNRVAHFKLVAHWKSTSGTVCQCNGWFQVMLLMLRMFLCPWTNFSNFQRSNLTRSCELTSLTKVPGEICLWEDNKTLFRLHLPELPLPGMLLSSGNISAHFSRSTCPARHSSVTIWRALWHRLMPSSVRTFMSFLLIHRMLDDAWGWGFIGSPCELMNAADAYGNGKRMVRPSPCPLRKGAPDSLARWKIVGAFLHCPIGDTRCLEREDHKQGTNIHYVLIIEIISPSNRTCSCFFAKRQIDWAVNRLHCI